MDYYVLDPTLPNADWDETTITPQTAAIDGIYTLDGDLATYGTQDPNQFTFLGTKYTHDPFVNQNTLAMDEAFNFILPTGSVLHDAIQTAQGTSHQTLTIALHNWFNAEADNPSPFPTAAWGNRNYLFQPKEFSGDTALAPSLFTTVPEPTSLALLSLGGLALLRRRR